MFAYCNNNPVASADPSGEYGGHQPIMVCDNTPPLAICEAVRESKNYKKKANCYAYAFNITVDPRTGEPFQTMPQPGDFSGKYCTPDLEGFWATLEKDHYANTQGVRENIIGAAKADGKILGFTIEEVSSANWPTNNGQWVVALGFGYNEKGFCDYHWWRRTESGLWFHKVGDASVSLLDASYNYIHDPQECKRGVYDHFFGYFLVTPTN